MSKCPEVENRTFVRVRFFGPKALLEPDSRSVRYVDWRGSVRPQRAVAGRINGGHGTGAPSIS